jgi:hypothetical protein
MLTIYRQLLRLYPAAYRARFGEEMLAVFSEVESENESNSVLARGLFCLREATGLISGALSEHLRSMIGAPGSMRRFTMRDGFRFPKATAVLMTIILAGALLAIKRGEDIAASLPHVNPQIAPIQPVGSVLLPPIALFFAFFYAAGLIGWAILFALRRSGVHRLAEISGERK